MNVGASAPEESGLYFSWGNSPGHAEGSGYNFSQELYNETPGAAIETNLTLAEDMARQSLGTPWRMPTAAEFQELCDNCTIVWTTRNGVNGKLFTSNINGKNIFIPAAGRFDGTVLNYGDLDGYYWSSSYNSAEDANSMHFDRLNTVAKLGLGRFHGFSVRAVR